MKWIKQTLVLPAMFLLGLVEFVPDAYCQEHPAVELRGTQLLSLQSTIVAGQEYSIQVNLPRFYEDTTRTFPVVYILDGQWDFALVYSLYGQQYYDGFLPELILVGIKWGGVNPNPDSLRARDLTPTHNDQLPQSGGGAQFLSFIKNELAPFIESNYRVKRNDRTLMGSSFGGLFTLYAMFQGDGFFNRFIAASPAIGWDRQSISGIESSFSQKNSSLPGRLYMVIGDYENVSGFQEFADHLAWREYDGFNMKTKVIENTGHSGSKAEGFGRGLQYVFERLSIRVDSRILDQYAGEYQINPSMRVRLFNDNGVLKGQSPQGVQVLHAESETDFYVRGQFLFVHFKKDEAGAISGFQLDLFGSTLFAKRIN